MSFKPNLPEQIARARADLRMGVPIVLSHPSGSLLVQAVETLEPNRFADARALPGLTALVITARRAQTLKARVYETDIARIAVPHSEDIDWIFAMSDPAGDLSTPMKGPLRTLRTGDAAMPRLAIQLTKDARLLPSVLVTSLDHAGPFALNHGLTMLDGNEAMQLMNQAADYKDVIHARLPMEVSDVGALHVFRPDDGAEEHYAVIVGTPDRTKPVLTRLHSACFTGDLIGSLKCDCGPQLRAALAQMGETGGGVLLYLNQEGRGIGLANKMRAYSLQDQGFDTVEANHRLGFEDDERDFRIGAALLGALRIPKVRLLTNNPAKIDMMQKTGIDVTERVPLHVGANRFNRAYLKTKAVKSGHMM